MTISHHHTQFIHLLTFPPLQHLIYSSPLGTFSLSSPPTIFRFQLDHSPLDPSCSHHGAQTLDQLERSICSIQSSTTEALCPASLFERPLSLSSPHPIHSHPLVVTPSIDPRLSSRGSLPLNIWFRFLVLQWTFVATPPRPPLRSYLWLWSRRLSSDRSSTARSIHYWSQRWYECTTHIG